MSQPSATLRVRVFSKVQPTAALRVRVFSPASLTLDGEFRVRVILAGEDVSDLLTGPVRIEAEESTARLAFFTLKPSGAFTPANWLNQSVAIEYFKGGVWWRRFSGVVDKPALSFTTRLIEFRCTDNLPRRMDDASAEQIAALTPDAVWSRFAFSADRTGWDYLQDRLATLRAGFCLTARGEPKLYAWGTGAPVRTFGAGETEYTTPRLDTAPGSDMINEITLSVQCRWPNLRAADAVWSWRYDGPLNAADLPYFPPSYTVIEEAVADLASGWSNGGTYLEQIPTQPGYAWSASGAITRRWAQDQTDSYSLAVRCPASIATFGALTDVESASMSIAYDESAWDKDGRVEQSDGLDLDPEAEAVLLVNCKLAQCARRIAATHRAHRYTWTTPLDPRLELGDTLRKVTGTRSITGQVWKLLETVDTEAGRAVSEITLAVSFTGVDGAQPQDPLLAPAAPNRVATPAYRLPALATQVVVVPASFTELPEMPDWDQPGWNAELWNTVTEASPSVFSGMTVDRGGHLSFFGTVDESLTLVTGTFSALKRAEFRVATPEVDAAYTDHVDAAVSAIYRVAVPNDEITITL